MLFDGLTFCDGQTKVIFNQYSFCELIKHLLTELAGISYEDASKRVDHSFLTAPVSNVTEVGLLGHELPYYWAMFLYYGNCYWEKGIPAQPEDFDTYTALENRIMMEHYLKEPFEWE